MGSKLEPIFYCLRRTVHDSTAVIAAVALNAVMREGNKFLMLSLRGVSEANNVAIPRLFAVIAWMLIILTLSVIRTGEGFSSAWPVFGHFFEYSVLAILIFRALPASAPKVNVSLLAAYSIVASTLYGIAIEIVQLFVPYRSFSVFDMLVNLAGASTVFIYWAVSQAQRRGEQ